MPRDLLQEQPRDLLADQVGPSAGGVIVERAARGFTDNLMGIPATIGRLQAGMTAPSEQTRRMAESQGLRTARFPGLLSSIPSPTVNDFAAGARALPGLLSGEFGDRFTAERERLEREQAAQAEAHPVASTVGDMTGDALTLAGIRSPLAILRRGRVAPVPTLTAPQIASVRGAIKSAFTTNPVKKLARGLGRAGEAGAEGAALAALHEGDPMLTAGLAAAGQMGGSAVRSVFGPKGGTLALAAAGLFAAHRLGQEFVPGQDNTFKAIDFAFEKLALGLVLGAGATVAGAGRAPSGQATKAMAVLADAFHSIPRGSLISLIEDFTKARQEGDDSMDRVVGQMARDPSAFTEEQRQQFERGLLKGKPLETSRDLLADQSFRDRLESVSRKTDQQIMDERMSEIIPESEKPMPAVPVAESLARHAPPHLRRTFEESGPRAFIRAALENESAMNRAREKMGGRFNDALEIYLDRLVKDATGKKGIDGAALHSAWIKTPAHIREAYPEETRAAVEAFADLTRGVRVSAFSWDVARALMNPDSALNRQMGVTDDE